MIRAFIAPLSYVIPLLVVMTSLRKRGRLPLRVLGSIVLFALCLRGLLLLQPGVEAWESPVSMLSVLLIYGAVLLLMACVVLFCCDVPFTPALFYAGAAYTVQNLTFTLRVILMSALDPLLGASPVSPGLDALVSISGILLVAFVFYLLFVRRIGSEGLDIISDKSAVIAISTAFVFNIAFSTACSALAGYQIQPLLAFVFRASHVGVCIIILYMEYALLLNKRLQIEAAATEQLIRDRERQYEASRETIDAINLKCHDIRHQIRKIGETPVVDKTMLDEITRKVDVYDTWIDTGNDALNTILTEKSLLCNNLGIELTCSADGSKLSFLSPAELYSLFGNMLDNAIEATRQLEDEAKRVVTLGVRHAAGLITIHEENYCAGKVRLADGIPQSTKGDPLNHGYGFRSMQAIVEGHGGVIDCTASGDIFCIDIVIPASGE